MTPRSATFGQHAAAVMWVIAVSLMFHGLMGVTGWDFGAAEAHTALGVNCLRPRTTTIIFAVSTDGQRSFSLLKKRRP